MNLEWTSCSGIDEGRKKQLSLDPLANHLTVQFGQWVKTELLLERYQQAVGHAGALESSFYSHLAVIFFPNF